MAGSDLKPGMWVIFEPGLQSVQVERIEPFETCDWLYVYHRADDKPIVARPNHWYAEVEL